MRCVKLVDVHSGLLDQSARRSRKICVSFRRIASDKALNPESGSLKFGSTPWDSSIRTIFRHPLRIAICMCGRGLRPPVGVRSILTSLKRSRVVSSSPPRIAWCSGVRPWMLGALIFTPGLFSRKATTAGALDKQATCSGALYSKSRTLMSAPPSSKRILDKRGSRRPAAVCNAVRWAGPDSLTLTRESLRRTRTMGSL
ncbi:unnamed protein product [Tuber aestivum]|uniref:Uncharacterized protein n=1 Tax=Tuber aestivum TaxID=59557 RepID=A0A292Q9G3_9PEZI|nr:unnamed protein product [Tuber aestivum]